MPPLLDVRLEDTRTNRVSSRNLPERNRYCPLVRSDSETCRYLQPVKSIETRGQGPPYLADKHKQSAKKIKPVMIWRVPLGENPVPLPGRLRKHQSTLLSFVDIVCGILMLLT